MTEMIMVLSERIELSTSSLPRTRSTTELRQHFSVPLRPYQGLFAQKLSALGVLPNVLESFYLTLDTPLLQQGCRLARQ